MEYTIQLPARLQTKLNNLSRRAQEKQKLAKRVDDFDYEMFIAGLPSYSQLAKSLRDALSTIDIILSAYDKGVNKDNFAMLARMDLADVEKKLGIDNGCQLGATFN